MRYLVSAVTKEPFEMTDEELRVAVRMNTRDPANGCTSYGYIPHDLWTELGNRRERDRFWRYEAHPASF